MSDTQVIDAPVDTPHPAPAGDAPQSSGEPSPSPQALDPASAGDAPSAEPQKDWYADFELAKDDKVAERLKRYGSTEDAIKAGLSAQDKLRESGRIKLPGENASDEDRAEFYSAIGAKESVADYDLTPTLPEGMEFTDANKAMLTTLAEQAFEKGGMLRSPEVIEFMRDAYGDVLQAQAVQMKEIAESKQAEYSDQIRKMWGDQFELNSKLASEGVSRFFGDSFEEIRTAQLVGEDGQPMGRVGDHPAFMTAMMEAVRQSSEDLTFTAIQGEPMGSEAIETEIKNIQNLRHSDPDAYAKKQTRLLELKGRLERVSSKAA